MTRQKTFGRSRPSIAYELEYRRKLQQLFEEMREDVNRELAAYLRKTIAADSEKGTWAKVVKWLRKKWYKRYDEQAKELSKWITKTTRKRTATQIMRKLKQIGFTLKPHYSKEDKEIIKVITENNAALIKSIPQEYLYNVQQAVSSAFLAGYDMQELETKIKEVVETVNIKTKNKTALLARDQINKATQQFAIFEAKSVGATKGRWIHVPGKYSSRKTHIKMDGKIFNLDDGLYDSDVHRNVKPGELYYCNCQFETLIPGFDE